MNKFSKPLDQELDEQLSKFADQVLSSNENEAIVQEEDIEQGELAELQRTVLRLKAAVKTARTNDVTNARIRNRLLTEWKKTRQAKLQTPKRFFWNWSLPRVALAGGFIVLIISGVMALLTPSAVPLVGTASGSQAWSPLFILAGIVVIVLLLWNNRQK